MPTLPTTITVIVDSREQQPLLFPEHLVVLDPSWSPGQSKKAGTKVIRVRTHVAALAEGDYALAEAPGGPLISSRLLERKKGLNEIAKNVVGSDRPRFLRALDRLRDSCSHPYCVLEGDPFSLSQRTNFVDHDPGAVQDGFLRALSERNIPIILLPSRTHSMRAAVGQWALRLMLSHLVSPPSGASSCESKQPPASSSDSSSASSSPSPLPSS